MTSNERERIPGEVSSASIDARSGGRVLEATRDARRNVGLPENDTRFFHGRPDVVVGEIDRRSRVSIGRR